MKIENLVVGKVYKNYKEICEFLNDKPKAGKSKQLQIKDWERYFNYKKDGHKWIITEIFNEPKEKTDGKMKGNNSSPYLKHMEILILDLLAHQNKGNTFTTSKNALLKQLKVINSNYISYKNKRPLLSKQTEICLDEINDYFDSSSSTFRSNVTTALNHLEKQSYIFVRNEITVCEAVPQVDYTVDGDIKLDMSTEINENGDYIIKPRAVYVKPLEKHRKATNDEIELIHKIERNLLDYEYKVDSKQALYKTGKIKEFCGKVNEKLFAHSNIMYYYPSYEIVFNHENVKKRLEDLILNEEVKEDHQAQLQLGVIHKLNKNAENRHSTATAYKAIGNDEDCKEFRTSDKYMENTYKLNSMMIGDEQNILSL